MGSAVMVGVCAGSDPIPTSASNSKLHFGNQLQKPEEASASEIITGRPLVYRTGITRQPLGMTGFAARLV